MGVIECAVRLACYTTANQKNISNPRIRDTAFVEFLIAMTCTETVVGFKLKSSVISKHL